jgi:putative ABC transport system permease protein
MIASNTAQISYITLSWWDLALASSLLLIDAGLSLGLRLGMTRSMIIAAVRMVVQLLLLALVLESLFALASPWITGVTALFIVLFAGREVAGRQERKLRGLWGWGLGSGSIFFAAVTVSLFSLTTQVNPDPWWDPRYALPMLGMILGNTMNGISLGLNGLTSRAYREKSAIEAQLSLGATRWQAFNPIIRSAVRAGLISIVNSMAAAGIVSIPGMMTGQLLAGVPPLDAVRYQILIMVLIAGATALGTLIAVLGGTYRLTDERHRLRLDRLKAVH